MAIFISKDSTFLPRYSGVRPTIKPGDEHRRAPNTSIPYSPAPTPPGVISPSRMWNIGTSPLIGCRLSCMALTAPVLVPGGDRGPQAAAGRPEPDLLAFHVAQRLVDAGRAAAGSRPLSATITTTGRDREDHAPSPRTGPSPGAGPRLAAERRRERERDDEDQEQLQEVREAVGVLERVGRVGVDEAAAIGAQLLDRLLGGDRPEVDRLLAHPGAWSRSPARRTSVARPATTRKTAPTNAIGQQDVERAARHVGPEVADGRRAAGGRGRGQRDGDGDADGRGHEVRTASPAIWMRCAIATSPE